MTDLTQDFCQWLDNLSRERAELAYIRAQRRELEFWDDDSFQEVLTEELKRMYVDETVESIKRKGVLVVDHVGENGELHHRLADGVKL